MTANIRKAVKPTKAFVLVSDDGWPVVSSTNINASQVRGWADDVWRGDGGYERAKKDGWRVRKVWMVDILAL